MGLRSCEGGGWTGSWGSRACTGLSFLSRPTPHIVTSPSLPDPAPPPAEPVDPGQLEPLRPGLELLALRALGDRELAREAAQEAIARAVAACAKGTQIAAGRLGAFVAGIARHVVTDMRRARARSPVLDVDTIPLPSSGPDPLELLLTKADADEVRGALRSLPPADRELLRLCFYEGLTPLEIATHLGEPAERIRKRKSRALERLRDHFLGHARPSGPTEGAEEV